MDRLYSYIPSVPDASRRRALTLTDLASVVLCYYAHAVMAMLPHTSFPRVALLPVTLRLTWTSAVTLDVAQYLANTLGLARDPLRVTHLNFIWVLAMWTIALKSFEWTFIIDKPIRRYETPKDGEPLKERPLTVASLSLDAAELLFNHRGLGWSWSSNPFPHNPSPPPSILRQFLGLVARVIALDAAHYLLQLSRPSTYRLEGDTIFDDTLTPIPRLLVASCICLFGMVIIYTSVEIVYQVSALFGQIVFSQSATQWPRIANQPWLSASVTEFWGERWHQCFRHLFIVYGSRPGREVAGWYGSIMGAYIVSAVMHVLGLWGLGRGTEFGHTGGFFIMIGAGTILERQWKVWTGKTVTGVAGKLWTAAWQLIWGAGMVDEWARRGMVANDFIAKEIRIGKALVDIVLTVVSRIRDT